MTTFTVTKRLVTLDVVVTDKKGNVVNDLNRDEFEVLEDNTPEKIESFEPPSVHRMPAGAGTETGAGTALVVKSSADLPNAGDAPVTILVLDELNTQFEDSAYARSAIRRYLSTQPEVLTQPTILLVVNGEKFGVIHDYTQDRNALLLAVKNHFPSLPIAKMRGRSTGLESVAVSLSALMQIAQASGGTHGRKNVIWVGSGFPSLTVPEFPDPKVDAINEAIKKTTQKLLQSRVTLYIIDPTPMSTGVVDFSDADIVTPDMLESATEENGSDMFPGDIQFATFAPSTGGSIFSLRNDVDRELATSINNGASYYTLSYSPTNKSEDAAEYRKIRVAVKRPGLIATTRTGYYPETSIDAGGVIKPPTMHELAFDLTSAGLSSMLYNTLKVSAERSKDENYVLHVDSHGLFWRHAANGKYVAEVTLMQVCFSAKNKVIYHKPFELYSASLSDPSHEPGNQQATFRVAATVPPGTAHMRFVIRDAATGKIGTTDIVRP